MYKKWILRTCVFIPYVAIAMWVGEVHPFSQFPMYNSFPKWSYVFYIKTEDGRIVSTQKELDCKNDWIPHIYYTACENRNIAYGLGQETPEQMKLVGDEIMAALLKNKHAFQAETLYFYKKHFYLEGHTLNTNETLMTKVYVE